MSVSCLWCFSVVILLTFFATLESRFVTVNLFKRTYVYLVVYIYLFKSQFVTVKSIYPICHHVREHMYTLLYTYISSKAVDGITGRLEDCRVLVGAEVTIDTEYFNSARSQIRL